MHETQGFDVLVREARVAPALVCGDSLATISACHQEQLEDKLHQLHPDV